MSRLSLLAFASAAIMSPALSLAWPAPQRQPDISREQARARAEQLFTLFDANHDGVITVAEAKTVGMRLLMRRAATGRDAAPGIGGQTLKYMEKAFSGMRWVTEQQFEDAFMAHFDQMDVNHDGVLTAAERLQGRADKR